MGSVLYKVSYDDGGVSCNLTDRKTAHEFSKNMKGSKNVLAVWALVRSKVKCVDCGKYPVWNQGDRCPNCSIKNEVKNEIDNSNLIAIGVD
jgi:hypothetical protein